MIIQAYGTKEQRKDIYMTILSDIESEQQEFMCSSLIQVNPYIQINQLPELWNQRPSRVADTTCSWFYDEECTRVEARQKRITLLNKAIKLCNDK